MQKETEFLPGVFGQRIYCWDCMDFDWGMKVTHRQFMCSTCGHCNTDVVVDESILTYLETEEKTMASNDNEVLRKECKTKSCRRKGVVVATVGRYCTACGQKLDICKDQTLPIEMVDPLPPARTQPALVVTGQPDTTAKATDDDPLVRVHHNTRWTEPKDGHAAGWICWCGDLFPSNTGQAGQHDRIVSTMRLSKVPVGVPYHPVQETAQQPKNDDWMCAGGSPDISGCPLITVTMKPLILIPNEMWEKWCFWAKKFNTEWLVYLIGEEIPRDADNPLGGYKLTDMYVPRQKVTGAHVTVDEEEVRTLKTDHPGIIGDVHSHVNMGVFFSAEDEKHFNHPVHLVVNSRNEITSSIRITLECGKTSRTTGKLNLTGLEDTTELEDELKTKFIIEPPPSAATATGGATQQSLTGPATADANQPARTISGYGGSRSRQGSDNKQDTWMA